jgi:anti-sigma factor RsiW
MNMSDQFHNKLSAYLDGELDPRARREVHLHLETCRSCQAELEELRGLSRLLRAAPLPEFTPALTFKNQLMLQLPRRADEQQPVQSSPRILPWLLPLASLGGWIFTQTLLLVSWLVSLAGQAGMLGGVSAWFSGASDQLLWVASIRTALSGALTAQSQSSLALLNDGGIFTQNLLFAFLLQVVAAMFYLGALALVWHYTLKPLGQSQAAE